MGKPPFFAGPAHSGFSSLRPGLNHPGSFQMKNSKFVSRFAPEIRL
jgi:hypothetical protein